MESYLGWNLREMVKISPEKLQRNMSEQQNYLKMYAKAFPEQAKRFNLAALLFFAKDQNFETDSFSALVADCVLMTLHHLALVDGMYFRPDREMGTAVLAKGYKDLVRIMGDNVKATMKYLDYQVLLSRAMGECSEEEMEGFREEAYQKVFPTRNEATSFPPYSEEIAINATSLEMPTYSALGLLGTAIEYVSKPYIKSLGMYFCFIDRIRTDAEDVASEEVAATEEVDEVSDLTGVEDIDPYEEIDQEAVEDVGSYEESDEQVDSYEDEDEYEEDIPQPTDEELFEDEEHFQAMDPEDFEEDSEDYTHEDPYVELERLKYGAELCDEDVFKEEEPHDFYEYLETDEDVTVSPILGSDEEELTSEEENYSIEEEEDQPSLFGFVEEEEAPEQPEEEEEKLVFTEDDEGDIVIDEPTPNFLPLVEQILSFAPMRENDSIVAYLYMASIQEQKDLVGVIEQARKAMLADGIDKMFTIPDTGISVAIISDSTDPMLKMQRMQNIGSVMYAAGKESWNALFLMFGKQEKLISATYQEVKKNSFSNWEWKTVEKMGQRLKNR